MIGPVQPMTALRGRSRRRPGGLPVGMLGEGDTFGMEDRGNRTGASRATDMRPVAKPRPDRIEPGGRAGQDAAVAVRAETSAGAAGDAVGPGALGRTDAGPGGPFGTVIAAPAPDLECPLPGLVRPGVQNAPRLRAAVRGAFPSARIGGGCLAAPPSSTARARRSGSSIPRASPPARSSPPATTARRWRRPIPPARSPRPLRPRRGPGGADRGGSRAGAASTGAGAADGSAGGISAAVRVADTLAGAAENLHDIDGRADRGYSTPLDARAIAAILVKG